MKQRTAVIEKTPQTTQMTVVVVRGLTPGRFPGGWQAWGDILFVAPQATEAATQAVADEAMKLLRSI